MKRCKTWWVLYGLATVVVAAIITCPLARGDIAVVDRYCLIRAGYRVPPGKQKRSTETRHVGDVIHIHTPAEFAAIPYSDLERTQFRVFKLTGIPEATVDVIVAKILEEIRPMDTWAGGEYVPGDEVQHGGTAYRCVTITETEPPSADWLDIGAPPVPLYRGIGWFNGKYNEGQIKLWLRNTAPTGFQAWFDTYWPDPQDPHWEPITQPLTEIPEMPWDPTLWWEKTENRWTTSADFE
jgi:hypothetical protein